MPTERRSRDRLFWSVCVAAVALTIITLIASRFVAAPPGMPRGTRLLPRVASPPTSAGELLRVLGVGSLTWYACFLAAPLFIWLNGRMPLRPPRLVAAIAGQAVVLVSLTALTAFVQYRVTFGDMSIAPPLRPYLEVSLITGMLPFLTVAVVAQALDARARAHDRELEAERMRSQLAESRLEALTAQLQPHFLFNTLQGISTLITRDPVAADRMLGNLSDLLRDVLRRGESREIELREELRVLESYLAIARERFGDRLTIDVRVPEEAALGLVPFFVLQPLVENALHHGVGSHAGPGRVTIDAARANGSLHLVVRDDGPGTAVPDSHRGIGLGNTTARLRELYGDAHSMTVGRPAEGGFRVEVTIPYRERASPNR